MKNYLLIISVIFSNFLFSQGYYSVTNGLNFATEFNGYKFFSNYYERDYDTKEIIKEKIINTKIVVSYYESVVDVRKNISNYGKGTIRLFDGDNLPITYEFNYIKREQDDTLTFISFNNGIVTSFYKTNGFLVFSFPNDYMRRNKVYFSKSVE